jgi:hypothetical protein
MKAREMSKHESEKVYRKNPSVFSMDRKTWCILNMSNQQTFFSGGAKLTAEITENFIRLHGSSYVKAD